MIADMSNKHHNKAPCAFEIILSMLLYFGFQKITKILLKTNQSMICNWNQLLARFCEKIIEFIKLRILRISSNNYLLFFG